MTPLYNVLILCGSLTQEGKNSNENLQWNTSFSEFWELAEELLAMNWTAMQQKQLQRFLFQENT